MSDCEQELCGNWTGSGCACEVFGVEPDLRTGCEVQDHPDEGDGCCRCGMTPLEIRSEQRRRAIDSVQQYFGQSESAATTAADIVDLVCRIFGVRLQCEVTWVVDGELHECLFRHDEGYHLCDCGARLEATS